MKLQIVSLSLIFFSVIVITLGIIKVHTYPGKIAKARNHPQTEAIEVTSLLGLMIFPFWMAALVWAYSGAVIGKLYAAGEGAEQGDAGTQEAQEPVAAADKAPSDAGEA